VSEIPFLFVWEVWCPWRGRVVDPESWCKSLTVKTKRVLLEIPYWEGVIPLIPMVSNEVVTRTSEMP
jgi:hypothetical protein